MPTLTIIGYLWLRRHSLGIETVSDVLNLMADLWGSGLDCLQVEDQIVLGTPVGASSHFPRRTREEWDDLVHSTLLDASVARTVHMMDDGGGDSV